MAKAVLLKPLEEVKSLKDLNAFFLQLSKSLDDFREQSGALMAGWKTDIRALWGHKELLEGKPGRAIQASSARYFANVADSFKKYEAGMYAVLEKESPDESDLNALKTNFLGILSLLEDEGLYAGRSKKLVVSNLWLKFSSD